MVEKQRIGNSELFASRVALGCWVFAGGPEWGNQKEEDSIATVHAALDLGINLFDTAPAYGGGESERILGLALQGRRDEALIGTKISSSHAHKEGIIASCDESLSLLKTDRIDLIQIHWPNHDVPFEETIEALHQLKADGKIRYAGVCNFGVNDMSNYLRKGGEMVSNQLPYSLLSRAIEYTILPECRQRDVSVLPYSPLLQGLLTGKFKTAEDVPTGRSRTRHFSCDQPGVRHSESGCESETFKALSDIENIASEAGYFMSNLAISWLLHQPGIPSVVMGARTPGQVEQNMKSLSQNMKSLSVPLSTEELNRLNLVTDPVKSILGSNPDLWQSEGRYN